MRRTIDFKMFKPTLIDGELLYKSDEKPITFMLIENYNGDEQTIRDLLFGINDTLEDDNTKDYYFYLDMLKKEVMIYNE